MFILCFFFVFGSCLWFFRFLHFFYGFGLVLSVCCLLLVACCFLCPTLAVGLLDFEVDVVLAQLEADFSAVPNRRVSLQCQPPCIPAVPNHHVSLQCPTTMYPCSAQPQNTRTLPNRKVSLHPSTTKYPRSAQPQRIPAVPNSRVSLQCPTEKYPCSAQPQRGSIRAAHLQCCKEDS